jgi:hypothetical protein
VPHLAPDPYGEKSANDLQLQFIKLGMQPGWVMHPYPISPVKRLTEEARRFVLDSECAIPLPKAERRLNNSLKLPIHRADR